MYENLIAWLLGGSLGSALTWLLMTRQRLRLGTFLSNTSKHPDVPKVDTPTADDIFEKVLLEIMLTGEDPEHDDIEVIDIRECG